MSEDNQNLTEKAADLANQSKALSEQIAELAVQATEMTSQTASHSPGFFITGLTVFVLACFVGYYVVWRVTPALHSPLMGITNAISSVIIVGALIAAGPAVYDAVAGETVPSENGGFAKMLGFFAVTLASINIFGGFVITNRMLSMFKKKGKA